MTCTITIGEVISHPCGRKLAHLCEECNEKVCKLHYDSKQKKCVVCTGAHKPKKGAIRLKNLFEFTEDDFDAFGAEQRGDNLDYLDS